MRVPAQNWSSDDNESTPLLAKSEPPKPHATSPAISSTSTSTSAVTTPLADNNTSHRPHVPNTNTRPESRNDRLPYFFLVFVYLVLHTIQSGVIVIVLMIASNSKSPTNPSLNEWEACSKPLGIWSAVWVGRAWFFVPVTCWGWWFALRSRRGASAAAERESNDVESASQPMDSTGTPTPTSQASPSSSVLESTLFTCLSILSNLCTVLWVLVALNLVYTTINTCRASSPHLFWLLAGILLLPSGLVKAVKVLFTFVFFILLMLFLLILNLVLGRSDIRPEIGKLSQALVDRLPLVVYIPAPPEDESGAETTASSSETWESSWEPSEHPFMRLEKNRAVCSICLMDFEEPPRKRKESQIDEDVPENQGSQSAPSASTSKASSLTEQGSSKTTNGEDEQTEPRLIDAGAGPQPLRLLPCGHVFHKTCIDPWLIRVSGRCAVCQHAVEQPSGCTA